MGQTVGQIGTAAARGGRVSARLMLGLAGTGLALASLAPALAQTRDGEGGLHYTLGISERLEAGSNLALENPPEGDTLAAITRLDFGMTSATRTQTLSFAASGALRLADEEDGERVSEFDEPRLRLGYDRVAANARLSFKLDLSRRRVDTLRSLEDFIDPDTGEVDIPSDLGDLEGSGERESYRMNARLDLGTAGPLGLILDAEARGIDYSQTDDPDLEPSRRVSAGAALRLGFSPTTEGRIALRRTEYRADDDEDTHRDTNEVDLGLSHALSPRTDLSAGIGYSTVDTEKFGDTTRDEGLTARLGVDIDLKNGGFDALLDSAVEDGGTRLTFSAGRQMTLPDGALTARLGVTSLDGGDSALIGGLTWQRNTRDGGLRFSLDRSVRTDDTDSETTVTAATLGYTMAINAVAGIDLRASYALIDETDSAEVERSSFGATYRRDLTADWGMNLGFSYTLRDREDEEQVDSQQVFLSLNRRFNW